MRQQFAVIATPEAEGHRSPEEPAAGFLVGLDLGDALTDAVALSLGECRRDRQEQLAYPVAGDVTA